jgi:hypothetical protein
MWLQRYLFGLCSHCSEPTSLIILSTVNQGIDFVALTGSNVDCCFDILSNYFPNSHCPSFPKQRQQMLVYVLLVWCKRNLCYMFWPYSLGHHQAPMNITQAIKINGYDTDPYSCNWWLCCQRMYIYIVSIDLQFNILIKFVIIVTI